MDLLTPQQRNLFRNIMRDAHDTFEKKVVLWYKNSADIELNGEDNTGNTAIPPVSLEVQLNYNYMRTWPITMRTETGDLDRQSVQVLINKQWLSEQGHIDGDGRFNYKPSDDYFMIDGLKYIAMGDTPASQVFDDDILWTIILKRDDTPTHKNR